MKKEKNNSSLLNDINTEMIKNIGNFEMPLMILQNFSETMRKNAESIKMAGRLLEEQANVICDAFHTFNLYAPKLKELQEFVRKINEAVEYKKIEKTVILKSGWWFTPSVMEIPAGQLGDAIKKYNNGETGALTRLFISVYQSNNCEYLLGVVEGWQKNNFFKSWKKHIEQAFIAHKNKQYNLSIPILLIIAEGITKYYCRDKGIKPSRSKGNENIKNTLENTKLSNEQVRHSFEMLEIDWFFEIIDKTIYKDTGSIKNKRGFRYVLNRHAVLHGEAVNYGTQKNSLQGFMLLDVLSLLK